MRGVAILLRSAACAAEPTFTRTVYPNSHLKLAVDPESATSGCFVRFVVIDADSRHRLTLAKSAWAIRGITSPRIWTAGPRTRTAIQSMVHGAVLISSINGLQIGMVQTAIISAPRSCRHHHFACKSCVDLDRKSTRLNSSHVD